MVFFFLISVPSGSTYPQHQRAKKMHANECDFVVYSELHRPAKRKRTAGSLVRLTTHKKRGLDEGELEEEEEEGVGEAEEEEEDEEEEEGKLKYAFMKGVSAVSGHWVAQLAAGTPLLRPPLHTLPLMTIPCPIYSSVRIPFPNPPFLSLSLSLSFTVSLPFSLSLSLAFPSFSTFLRIP